MRGLCRTSHLCSTTAAEEVIDGSGRNLPERPALAFKVRTDAPYRGWLKPHAGRDVTCAAWRRRQRCLDQADQLELVASLDLSSLNTGLVVGVDVEELGREPDRALQQGNECAQRGFIERGKVNDTTG